MPQSSAQSSTLQIQTARAFKPLLQPARYKGAYGGRGSGKSHFFAELAIERCLMQRSTRIVCVREVQRSLKESVKLLLEDKIEAFGVGPMFEVQTDRILTPGNGIILFAGMQDHTAESIKSLEAFDVAYVEEAQTLTARSLEMLRPTIRKDGSELWFSWNPRNASDPVDNLLRGVVVPEDAIVVEANWRDNPFFPQELHDERLHDYRNNPTRYDHIWEGGYEPQAIGAIWDRETIHRNRVAEAPEMKRILVGIDPPKKSDEGANEAGLVVGGLGVDGCGYVLADGSRVASPLRWARDAVALYDLYEGDAIVVEINNGGEMAKQTIRSVRQGVSVIEVTATRGKHVRAEPIAALYSLDKIKHVGAFPELERQMCLTTATGYEGEGSPDRMDAMVWVFTELFARLTRKAKPKRPMPKRVSII